MEGISKTQIKKQNKRLRIAEKYKKQKAEKKSSSTSCSQEKNEGVVPHGIRQERNHMMRADFESKCEQGPLVIIDCEWDGMTPKERLSLTQQIMYSYACNKNGRKPVRLWVVGANLEQKQLLHKLPGSSSWYMAVTSITLEQLSLAPCSIYLTADSNHVLDDSRITETTTLIIGGIVDRNRNKNATLNKAETLSLSSAQLPIGQYLPLKSSKVLTVNHVVQLIVEIMDHHDWEKALNAVIPNRKRELENTSVV